jgi:hypothetical protein
MSTKKTNCRYLETNRKNSKMMKSTMFVLLITVLLGMTTMASAQYVTSWNTTNGADTPYPLTHEVILNQTAKFSISFSPSQGWSAKIYGTADGTNWTQLLYEETDGNTSVDGNGSGTQNPAVLTIYSTNYDGTLISNSTLDTMRVEFCNQTGSDCANLSVGAWTSMLAPDVNPTTLTVATASTTAYNITDQTGATTSGYIGFSPATQLNDSSPLATSDSPRSLMPVYAGSMNFYVSNAAGSQAAIINAGGAIVNNKTVTVGAMFNTTAVAFGSTPATIYKNFQTNVTVNLSALASSIAGWGTAPAINTSAINYSITVSAGGYSNATTGTGNMSAGSFVFAASGLRFNSAQVGAGNVNVSVRVKLDVNNDGTWDYDTIAANRGIAVDADPLILVSMTPSNKIMSVSTNTAQDNNLAYSFLNSMDQPADFTLTISNTMSSPIYYCNNTGDGCSDLLVVSAGSSANIASSAGAVDLNVYPEQKGSFNVSISSNEDDYTLATDTITVTGAIVNRTAISPALGATLIYGQTYQFSIPVKKTPNANDFAANISVRDTKSNGANFSVDANYLNANSSNSNGALYLFSVTPADLFIGDTLSIDVIGLNGSAYFRNAYTIDYPADYTLDELPCTLEAGFRNNFEVSVSDGDDPVTTGNLTVTYLDSEMETIGSPNVTELSGATTEITLDIPANAEHASFIVVDDLNHKQSEETIIDVSEPTMAFAGIELRNDTLLAGMSAPSNLVMIRTLAANLTFNVSAGCIMTPQVYFEEIGGTVSVTGGTVTIPLSESEITTYMDTFDDYSDLTDSTLTLILEDEPENEAEMLNITVAEPTINVDPNSVMVNMSTSVDVEVSAYGTGIPNLNITLDNIFNGTTDADGIATILVNATEVDSLPVYINTYETTESLEAIDLVGDANGDGEVNFDDLALLASAYNTESGDPLFDASADFNGDGEINFDDLALLASNYGEGT